MNEFKKIKNNNETRYVLETMTAGATGASAIATAEKDIGEVQKRIPDTSKPRNFVAKNAKMGGAGQHKDKKKAEKQGSVKHKKSYMESLRTQINQLKSKLAEQGVAEGQDATTYTYTVAYKDTKKPGKSYSTQVKAASAAEAKAAFQDWDDTGRFTYLGSRPNVDKVHEGVAEGSEQDDPYKGTTPTNGIVAARNGHRLGKTYNNPHSPKYHKDSHSSWDKNYNNETARLKKKGVAEAPEDRTSYQVAKILADRGIKYDPAQEDELINAIGMVLVKELNMSPKQARHLISYDEDFVADTFSELSSMENAVSEVAPPGWEKTVKAMKKHDEIDNPFALAWSMKNKGYKSHKKESSDPYFESLASKLDQLKKK
jgi:hypothetical protein